MKNETIERTAEDRERFARDMARIAKKNEAKFTPDRPELTFDGCGINGPDEYRTRIATFNAIGSEYAEKYGPLFASAPDLLRQRDELLAALQAVSDDICRYKLDISTAVANQARAVLASIESEAK